MGAEPSTTLAQMGAHIIVNLSGHRMRSSARRAIAATCSPQGSPTTAAARTCMRTPAGESTATSFLRVTILIAENGALAGEQDVLRIISADIDLQRLGARASAHNTFESIEGSVLFARSSRWRTTLLTTFLHAIRSGEYKRSATSAARDILTLQATGLQTCSARYARENGGRHRPADWITLALIVLVHAFDMPELDRKGILAVTMLRFGTTARTWAQRGKTGRSLRRYAQDRISARVDQHFMEDGQSMIDSGPSPLRTVSAHAHAGADELANKNWRMVVGTATCPSHARPGTYNGDHMSMYGEWLYPGKTLGAATRALRGRPHSASCPTR